MHILHCISRRINTIPYNARTCAHTYTHPQSGHLLMHITRRWLQIKLHSTLIFNILLSAFTIFTAARIDDEHNIYSYTSPYDSRMRTCTHTCTLIILDANNQIYYVINNKYLNINTWSANCTYYYSNLI